MEGHPQGTADPVAEGGETMKQRMLVNIRGCNGSGKSTIPLSMMDDPELFVETLIDSKGEKVVSLTIFPSYGWVALGTYFNKTGGLDTVRCIEAVKIGIHAAICLYPDYDILMEGILCSTTFSSYAAIFHEVETTYPMKTLILSLMPPVEVAINRVYTRNGNKPIKEELIEAKWGMVYRSHQKFKKDGFCTVRVDSSKVTKERMLPCFTKTIEKNRRTI